MTAELADLAVDQSELVEDRFTLIAPDNYRSDYLEIKLWSKAGDELARESLYVEDDEERGRGRLIDQLVGVAIVLRRVGSERGRELHPDL